MERSFPEKMPAPALRAFRKAGYGGLDDIAHVPANELLQLHGVGPKAIRLIREALESDPGRLLSEDE